MTMKEAPSRHLSRRSRRRSVLSGTSTVEVLVAFTLVTSVLSLSVPLIVRHGRVLTASRQYRLAVDELSNQLERLTAMPDAELQAALGQLTPSEFTAARLPAAELSGKLEAADVGQRLTLQIVWNEPGRREAPVSMAAWVLPDSGRGPQAPVEERPR
jgi:hypothetical protein